MRPDPLVELEPDPIGRPRWAWPCWFLVPIGIELVLHLIGVM